MSAIGRRLDRLEQDHAGSTRVHAISYCDGTDPERARQELEQQLRHAIPERDLIVYVKRYTGPLGAR